MSQTDNVSHSYPDVIRKLLDWRLPKFLVRYSNVSTSPRKTATGAAKRKISRQNDRSPFASLATPPPTSATTKALAYTTARQTQRHSTRKTTVFDRHLRKDLILLHTAVLPSMTHDLAILCDTTLAVNCPRDWNDSRHTYSAARRDEYHANQQSRSVSKEASIVDSCAYREKAAAALLSTALTTDGVWPTMVGEGNGLLHWFKEADPNQTKGLGDAFLYVDNAYLTSLSSQSESSQSESSQSESSQSESANGVHTNANPELVGCLKTVVDQDLSPFVVWEFKDITCATLSVMIAIRCLCDSKDIFGWIACNGNTVRCEPAEKCRDPETGKYLVSGRLAGFDSPVMEQFIRLAAARKDIGLAEYKIKPTAEDFRTALLILEQIWTQLVIIEGTLGIIHGGNYELIAIRHRATQSLLLSDIQYTPDDNRDVTNLHFGVAGPSHMRLHMGLFSLATVDVVQRAQIKAFVKSNIDENQLPSRMVGADKFTLGAWLGGIHIDTGKKIKGARKRPLAWENRYSDLGKNVKSSTRLQLRFTGNNAAFSHLGPKQGWNVLNLGNVDQSLSASQFQNFSSSSATVIYIIPKNNKANQDGWMVCNMGASFSSDEYYSPTFWGILATNSHAVSQLIRQYRVHQSLEDAGPLFTNKIQDHLGCFVNERRDLGILFLESIDLKAYRPLSDPSVQRGGLQKATTRNLTGWFEEACPVRRVAHGSLVAKSIYVRVAPLASMNDPAKLFYVTDWRLGIVRGSTGHPDLIETSSDEELATVQTDDNRRLKLILESIENLAQAE